jgi:hypothetical protein
MVTGTETYMVVGNSGNYVTVFGDTAVDSTSSSFEIRPWKVNVMNEDSEKRLSIGSSAGMLWDNGGFFAADRNRDGSILSVGHSATINSLNLTGTVEMVLPLSDKTIISAHIDKHVTTDELAGMVIKFSSSIVSDMEIVSNGAGRHDGTVSLTVNGDTSAIISGDTFIIEGVDVIRVYVTFDGTVSQGDLDGGYIVSKPEDYDFGLSRENYPVMRIVSNTDSYIDISRDFEGPDTLDPIAALVVGGIVHASNGDGTVPVNVEFDTQRGLNEIRNHSISVSGSEAFPSGGKVRVVSNDEISLTVDESYSGNDSDEIVATYSIFNTLIPGDEFFLSSLPFVSRPGFNNKLASVSFGHYHDYNAVPGPITGTVSGFGTVTSYDVELLLENVVGLDNDIVSSTPDIFESGWMLAYRKDSPSVKYRLEIKSHDSVAESITVSRVNGVFDFANTDDNKVGEGYSIILDTTGYGNTSDITFTGDYVVSTVPIVSDALIGDTVVTVQSVSDMGVGIKLRLTDDTGISFAATVVSIAGNDVELSIPLTVDLLVSTSARAEVLYGAEDVADHSVVSTVSIGDDSIVVDDASDILVGDVATIQDGSGESDSHVVASVLGATVELETTVGRGYVIGSTVSFKRYNYSSNHSHTVRRGEFSLAEDGSVKHGHYLSPLIQEVVDLKDFYGTSYAVGSGHRIYVSGDNGETWSESVNLSKYPEFNPLPSHLSGIYAIDGTTVACAASSGYLIYQSFDYVRYVGNA